MRSVRLLSSRSAALTASAVLAFGATSALASTTSIVEAPWAEVLGPAQGEWAPPQDEVRWRSDLFAAVLEAEETGRPLFVTLRCLPCKQCAGFDQAVLEGGPELDPLLRRFITVRLTDAAEADLRILPMSTHQDLDLSWWGYFLSDQARLYGVFGGKDHVSDATRISPAALVRSLERVLDHHYDPRRPGWGVDGPPPDLDGYGFTPRDLPGYEPWAAAHPAESCLHCHQVQDVLRQPELAAGTFDKQRDVYVWPLPENIGLEVERDDGLRVTRVAEDGPAARAGLRVGDVLATADDVLLFGQADLRGVLHRGPSGAGSIDLRWTRDGVVQAGRVDLRDGWRRTELGWRMSISQGIIGGHPGFAWGHAAKPADRRRLGIPAGSMAMRPWFGDVRSDWPASVAGLRQDDVVVAVGEASPDVFGREFMLWFRLNYEPGDTVVLTARDARGRDRKISYIVPKRE